jgi:hypothetical protein
MAEQLILKGTLEGHVSRPDAVVPNQSLLASDLIDCDREAAAPTQL